MTLVTQGCDLRPYFACLRGPKICVTVDLEDVTRGVNKAGIRREGAKKNMRVTFLKLIRIAAGYSQQQLAGRLGIHASLLCRYENDSRPIPKRLKDSFVVACAPRVNWPPLVRRARQ